MAGSILSDDVRFHLQVKTGDVGEYALLCGDPGRVPLIAQYLEDAKFVASNREYVTYTGKLDGVAVSVVSTGIGGPSSAICVEELAMCGTHTFLRVGTSGGMRGDVVGGDLVIASAAVRDDGTSREYLPLSYPAAADFDVTMALYQAAQEHCDGSVGNKVHVGVVQSKDSFYGETNPAWMPVEDFLNEKWKAYLRCGCLTSEMECAAIYAVAAARGLRAGGVMLAIWNVEHAKDPSMELIVSHDVDRAIRCGVGAVRRLIAMQK